MKKRITYLDMAKGIGIVLVVIGHLFGALQTIDNKTYFSPVYHVIASFHMPLFFIISGMLMHLTGEEKKPFIASIKRKAKTLLIPYATFSLIYLVMNIVVRKLMPKLVEEKFIWEIFWNTVTLRGTSVLWFLPALFFAEIFFLLTKKKMKEKQMIIFWCVLGFAMLLITPVFRWSGWSDNWYLFIAEDLLHLIVRSIICTLFLMIGYYLWPLISRGNERSLVGFLLGTIILVLFGTLSFANDLVDLNYLSVGNPIWYLVLACGNSVGLILLCKNAPQIKLLIFYGVNSLIIMCTHMEFKVMMYSIEFSYWLNKYVTRAKEWVLYATIWISMTVIEVVLIYLYNHYFYFLIGKNKPVGKRKGAMENEKGKESVL